MLHIGIVAMLHRAERELTHLLSLNQLTHIDEWTAWVAAEAEAGLAGHQLTGAAVPCIQSTRPDLAHGNVVQVRGVFPAPACLGCELVHKQPRQAAANRYKVIKWVPLVESPKTQAQTTKSPAEAGQ